MNRVVLGRDRPCRDGGAASVRGIDRLLLVGLLTATCAAIAGCSRFDPDAPWTLPLEPEETTPIPEGTPVIRHDPVAIEARSRRIDLVEDLVIHEAPEPFYRLIDAEADAQGNIYVHDAGNRHVVVFDRDGNHLRTLGRAGQGPGELGEGGRIAVAGGRVAHVLRNRLNAWASTGELVDSRNIAFTSRLSPVEGTDDGGLVGFMRRRRRGEGSREVVVRLSLDSSYVHEYSELPHVRQLMVVQGSYARNTGLPRPRPDLAVARSGEVYVTAGAEYEVLAFAPGGEPRWALRVAWPRIELSDERIDRALRHVMGLDEESDIPSRITSVSRSDVEWPELLPALHDLYPLKVDGHGHLYVFPFIPDDWDRPDQPIDVYSAEGEHLFSGMIPIRPWETARGDFVYAAGTDPVSEEYRVVRYRLMEPFE